MSDLGGADIGAAQIISGGGAFSDYTDYSLGYSPATRRVSEIVNQVRRTFGDEAAVQISDSDIFAWVNDAQDEIVNTNKPLKTRSFTYTVKGIAEYQFPGANIAQLDAIHYDGRPLKNSSFAQIEQDDPNPNVGDGTPQVWYEWGGAFKLYPAPDDAKQLTLFYTARPERISRADQVLSVPDKYYQAIRDYVLAQAYELDENYSAMQAKRNQFDAAISQRGEEERTAQSLTYETITLIDGDEW